MPDATVYKVLTEAEMAQLEADGRFAGSNDDRRDGFIHLSTCDQLTETVRTHFAGREDLVIVALDVAGLGPALKWEESRGGASFPHLYGVLTLETVVAYSPLHWDGDHVRLPVTG